DNVLHAEGPDDEFNDVSVDLTYTVTDADGPSATGTLTVGFDDDAPTASDFEDLEVQNQTGVLGTDSGAGTFQSGADGWSNIAITLDDDGGATGLTYTQSTDNSGRVTFVATEAGVGGDPVYTFFVDPDGFHQFQLLKPDAGSELVTSLEGPKGGGKVDFYTFTNDTVDPVDDVFVTPDRDDGGMPGVNVQINPSASGLAGDSNSLVVGDVLLFTFQGASDTVIFDMFGGANDFEVTAFHSSDRANTSVVLDGDGAGNTGYFTSTSGTGNAPGELVIAGLDEQYDSIRLEVITSDASLKVTGVSQVDKILPEGLMLEFGITGTDGDGDIATDSVNVAVLVDGVVSGIHYETTSGLQGSTDDSGAFQYRSGDSVTFSVGNVVLGTFLADEVMADGKVFLQEIAGVGLEDMNDDYVENMAVLLQSLDNDGDAYNGIVINDSIHEALSDDSFDLKTISKSDLADVLEENGYTPVDEDDAMQHVRDMIEEHAGLTEFEARTDNVFATDGDDVFAFALSDSGDAPADVTISGFGEEGSDSLDLRDLLAGEEAADDLSAYLNVSFDGESTIVEVSASGSFQGNQGDATLVDQTITLEGVDLVGGMDDVNSVIQSMLDSGKLTIDS
ncbi:MAG: type I secretion C-terminal target domain-containing protein, partial [Halioglobus sp.]